MLTGNIYSNKVKNLVSDELFFEIADDLVKLGATLPSPCQVKEDFFMLEDYFDHLLTNHYDLYIALQKKDTLFREKMPGGANLLHYAATVMNAAWLEKLEPHWQDYRLRDHLPEITLKLLLNAASKENLYVTDALGRKPFDCLPKPMNNPSEPDHVLNAVVTHYTQRMEKYFFISEDSTQPAKKQPYATKIPTITSNRRRYLSAIPNQSNTSSMVSIHSSTSNDYSSHSSTTSLNSLDDIKLKNALDSLRNFVCHHNASKPLTTLQ